MLSNCECIALAATGSVSSTPASILRSWAASVKLTEVTSSRSSSATMHFASRQAFDSVSNASDRGAWKASGSHVPKCRSFQASKFLTSENKFREVWQYSSTKATVDTSILGSIIVNILFARLLLWFYFYKSNKRGYIVRFKAGDGIWTCDRRFTKPLLYHWATPAQYIIVSNAWMF